MSGHSAVKNVLMIAAMVIKGVSDDNCFHDEGSGDIQAHSDRSNTFGGNGSIGG